MTRDFFLNQTCGTDRVIGVVDVFLVTGPPLTRTWQREAQLCVDVPWATTAPPTAGLPPLTAPSAWAIIDEDLPRPAVAISPPRGLTGLDTWLWHGDDATAATVPVDHDRDPASPPHPGMQVTATAGPYSLAATVWIERWTWDIDRVGTVTATRPGGSDDPAATVTFRTRDHDGYTVEATHTWAGRYSWSSPDGAGTDLDMGTLDVSAPPVDYPVVEVRAVPVVPDGRD